MLTLITGTLLGILAVGLFTAGWLRLVWVAWREEEVPERRELVPRDAPVDAVSDTRMCRCEPLWATVGQEGRRGGGDRIGRAEKARPRRQGARQDAPQRATGG